MKSYTNHTAGPRGFNTADGTIWIEPGQTLELDPETFVGDAPYLGKPGDAPSGDEKDRRIAELETEVAALKAKLAAGTKAEPATADEITAAIGKLDKGNEKHWTQAGLPEVAAIAEITGKSVTRKAIEEAAPDAKRPTE